jgi:2-keto-4-pentenoate hydratase/2-oxohepta-3-ene-1,7-dioic acid hydratase in catechol pathway
MLAAGDVVRIEIERIGAIENRLVCEPDETAVL